MEIRKVPISALNPAEYNPRKDLKPGDPEYDALKRSIEEFDLVEPLVWNEVTGNLVGGHQRLKILVEKGQTEVEVSVVRLDPEKEKLLNLALNKIQGDWDYLKLGDLLRELESAGADLDLSGFGKEEIERLLRGLESLQKEEMLPEPEKRAEPGQIWRLGRHRVACGDCGDPECLKRLFGAEKADAIITSPPYAEQRKAEYGGIPPEVYPAWFVGVAENFKPFLGEGASFFLNIKEHVEDGQRSLYVFKLVIEMVERGHWRFVDELIWKKPGLPGGWNNRLKNDFEPVFWFSQDDPHVIEREVEEGAGESFLVDEFGRVFHFSRERKIRFYPKSLGRVSSGVRVYSRANVNRTPSGNVSTKGLSRRAVARPGNVIQLNPNSERWKHPAMYPVDLAGFFIKLVTVKGDLVFDPFLGSGSTLIAAERLERSCFGVEIKPEYVDVILARWEQETGERAHVED